MGLPHLVICMAFGILCAATCITAGLGWLTALAAYALGGALNLFLLLASNEAPAERTT